MQRLTTGATILGSKRKRLKSCWATICVSSITTSWHLWKADIPTDKSVTLDTKEIDLLDDAVITGIRLEYGTVAADFTTRSAADSWTRRTLKTNMTTLTMSRRPLNSDARGAVVHMQATSSLSPQTALASARASISVATAVAINSRRMMRTASSNDAPASEPAGNGIRYRRRMPHRIPDLRHRSHMVRPS